MGSRWLDTKTDSESQAHREGFWEHLSAKINVGDIWADRIKEHRHSPKRRLETALENLPLPAAFGEAAKALRTVIRKKRKENINYEDELAFLYWLAAIESFRLDYAPNLKEPGFNVVQEIPGAKIKSLSFSYRDLGYENLRLLTKTDCKWIVDAWGEPDQNVTLYDLHSGVWKEYEKKLIQKRHEERVERLGLRREAHSDPQYSTENDAQGRQKYKFGPIIAAIAALGAIMYLAMQTN